ncbi:MAG: DegT/DnrJ/EryC1/StrS family aminotransferase [Acidimicrobiia bacterium]|nr:DegT/DnrJ/EryC1/StrS family aminotransferase [Acidimicrobiia bacterium]
MRASFLPLARPSVGREEEREVIDTLRSGWLSTGPKVARFESDLAAATQAAHVVALNSCTAALHLALLASGIGPGDEVVVPAITFPATANAILHCGATPRVVDVEAGTLNLDPAALSAAISSRCRAVIPVHMAGQPAEMDAIISIAAERGVLVIDDAAHAAGATIGGRPIGGDARTAATCFSFHAAKNVTTGEGGALLTAHRDLADRVRLLGNHGLDQDSWARRDGVGDWVPVASGFKYNLTDIAASIGIHQLRRLDGEIDRRQALAQHYRGRLADSPVVPLDVRGGRRHAWQLFVVVLPVDWERGVTRRRLRDANVGSGVHFPALQGHQVYRERCVFEPLPVADQLSSRLVSLPMFGQMTEGDVDDVVVALAGAV